MFNPEEAEICKRRGHSELATEKRWSECACCGTFYREVRTIEEREDEPPAKEQYPRQSTEQDGNPEEAKICKRRGHPGARNNYGIDAVGAAFGFAKFVHSRNGRISLLKCKWSATGRRRWISSWPKCKKIWTN